MTSKGTFTLPVKVRKAMGVNEQGDQLLIHFDPATNKAEIFKSEDFRALQKRTAKYLKKGKEPLVDLDEFYQKNRQLKAK